MTELVRGHLDVYILGFRPGCQYEIPILTCKGIKAERVLVSKTSPQCYYNQKIHVPLSYPRSFHPTNDHSFKSHEQLALRPGSNRESVADGIALAVDVIWHFKVVSRADQHTLILFGTL